MPSTEIITPALVAKLKAERNAALAKRDLADHARRQAVDDARQLGQQNQDLRETLEAVTDSRAANERLAAENAELTREANANAAALRKAQRITAACDRFADADDALDDALQTLLGEIKAA